MWQLGMAQYVCERFDTRGARLAGVSSGAISAGFFLALEAAVGDARGSDASTKARQRAHEIFAMIETTISPMMGWPLGFVSRIGSLLDVMIPRVLPDARAGNRVLIGMRRLNKSCPAIVPDVMTNFESKTDLVDAIQASSTVWLVVRPNPMRWLAQKAAFCSDGVNPFSFFCVFEYMWHLLTGLYKRTAPSHTAGGLQTIYAMWNCGVMRKMLPFRGTKLWLTPTVGGKLLIYSCLRFSTWFMAEQWRQGYAHARELDAKNYWHPLPRRA